jgi:TPR repeat protein
MIRKFLPLSSFLIAAFLDGGVGHAMDLEKTDKDENPSSSVKSLNLSPKELHDEGVKYFYGTGVLKDHKEALKYAELAAKAEYLEAEVLLGLLYYQGNGIERNDEKGFLCIKNAAEKGSLIGLRNMGLMYYMGKGVKQDFEQAISCFEEGVKKEDIESYYGLGLVYAREEFIGRDLQKAKEYFTILAEKGHEKAKMLLERVNEYILWEEAYNIEN